MKIKLTASILWPIVFLIVAGLLLATKPWQTKPQETISVSSQGTFDATPDIAKITATIESKNPNLDTGRADNEKKINVIIPKLKDLGVLEKDIKTQNISAGQGYQVQTMMYPVPPKPTTNNFSTTLELTLRNFKIADSVIATLTQNGATNIYGPQLTLSDDKLAEAKSKARENAVADAKNKAKELAQASGRSVGKVVKITEQGDFGYPVPMMARSSAELDQKASQIQPGQNQVSINLSVDFSLK
jgi:hypothetical protein